jgi:hypothetical protein
MAPIWQIYSLMLCCYVLRGAAFLGLSADSLAKGGLDKVGVAIYTLGRRKGLITQFTKLSELILCERGDKV